MKTKLLIASIACSALLASCEKDYSCTCKEIDASTGKVEKTYTFKQTFETKSEAKSWCSGMNDSYWGLRRECTLH